MFPSGHHVHLRKAASTAARRNRAQKIYRSSLAVHDAPRSKRPSSIVYGALATTGLATAYFFWPDASRAAPTYDSAILSPAHFTPTTLVASEACPDTETRLLTLKLPPQSIPSREENIFAPIWSIFIKDDDIQVERPYTPLEGIDEEGRMKLWIKRYPKGEVGRWLHSKNVNDKIEIRGPVKTWPWQEGQWDEVIMISGGTGITPFYQLLHHAAVKNDSRYSQTRFTLLHSSRRPIELPPTEILAPLLSCAQKSPERLTVSLFVDSLEGPQHPSITSAALRFADRIRPFGRNFSQGEVGGVLAAMGYEREQVWKL
ncbi:predicted protein [Postia placenta Mad-698-R]|uniref:FAD-binding FR-type domain-containing protein n=1 Tax=Postia placenta MAD-698-R-SB12 TaxID=670580 RepID=A0A1X6MVR5_9APHY|nr:hypothetical protein POSPLADRAFT_1147222 [Postia placenta MAD-698-R-SB12]EED84689.1 predicted protein [Postia placenta Mad-698-R]OSX60322.1 hypothetical protein POSPLADRAFT_1147222 [Postia placenta MAD-698-R-SB12]